MLCKRCEDETGSRPTRPNSARSRMLRCDRCGAAILTCQGVAVGVGDRVLALLGQFGLATRGKPLLQPKRREN